MLLELNIKNYILIKEASILFHQGLNIITGETGAGKSIIFSCINIICGEKFPKDNIKRGTDTSTVQALISIAGNSLAHEKLLENDIVVEEDDTILISREMSISGRGSAKINGQLVTVTMLKEITNCFTEIINQNEHQKLLQNSTHIKYLDLYIGKSISEIKRNITVLCKEINEIEINISDLEQKTEERARNIEFLTYQINEINEQNLEIGEEEILKAQKNRLANGEKLKEKANNIYEMLFNGINNNDAIIDMLNNCKADTEELNKLDESTNSFSEVLSNSLYQLEDIKYTLRNYINNIEVDDEGLGNIDDRLNTINTLKRKYGKDIEEILSYEDKIQKELDSLLNSEKNSKELIKQKEIKLAEYSNLAKELTKIRVKAAKDLEKKIETELLELNMKNTKFNIKVNIDQQIISNNGYDDVLFYISTNIGTEQKELSKIASGGELSRIILAIKNALMNKDISKILVFDEVDAGISGVTADIIGSKLQKLSMSNQLILISHLPQIVAYADNHILVEKQVKQGETFSNSKTLNKEESINEIAKMISGKEIEEKDINYIKDLIKDKKK